MKKYNGNKYVKSYTCWNQLLTMIFGQLSNRESLRDLIVAMEAHSGKLYHLGIGKSVTRSNLSKANEQRDCRIFEEYASFMISEARRRKIEKIFELDGHVYAFERGKTAGWYEFDINSHILMHSGAYGCNFAVLALEEKAVPGKIYYTVLDLKRYQEKKSPHYTTRRLSFCCS